MPRVKSERISEKFVSKESLGAYKFKIVEYSTRHDLWIQFEDKHGARVHTNYNNCQKGEVKNPYHKSVYGVACLGLMSDGSKPKITINGKNTREYSMWHSMIKRCYSEKGREKNPTYKNCSVCDRWLVYANFLEDLPKIENYKLWKNNDGYALDKDLKQQNVENKVYSLETCCFVTQSDNNKEMNSRRWFRA